MTRLYKKYLNGHALNLVEVRYLNIFQRKSIGAYDSSSRISASSTKSASRHKRYACSKCLESKRKSQFSSCDNQDSAKPICNKCARTIKC